MRRSDLSPSERTHFDRREFIKYFTIGSAVATAGMIGPGLVSAVPAPAFRERSRVALATGTDRRQMVQEIMAPWRDQLREQMRGKQVIIKPNMVVTNVPLCATHADALRGVLDFIKPLHDGQVIIAESSASGGGALQGFENYGYLPLEKEYGVKFIDLNTEPPKDFMILGNDLHPLKIQVCGRYLDPNNFIISVTRLKTHDRAVVTLGTKNIAMSAPYKTLDGAANPLNWKRAMHGIDTHWTNYNLYQVIQSIRPQFSVIESVVGMQGNGPASGFEMEHGVALAGDDFVAVDSIGAQLMGVDLENVGVLNYLGDANVGIADRARIDIVGGKDPAKFVKKYQMHDTYQRQLVWKDALPLQTPQP